jgi:dynein heavy chain
MHDAPRTQVTSDEVSARVAQAEATEREIDATREQYRPVASNSSLLFFAISELAAIDPMYQFSLGWFLALFGNSMDAAPKVRHWLRPARCASVHHRARRLC